MEIICKVSEEIECALALLSDEERDLVLQGYLEVNIYGINNDISKLIDAELTTPECDLERVGRLAAARRMLDATGDDELEAARELLKRAQR